MCSLDHMLLVKDLVEIQHRQYTQNQEYMDRYMLENWADVEHELLRERGLWGPIVGSRLDKWMLDMTEGNNMCGERIRLHSRVTTVVAHAHTYARTQSHTHTHTHTHIVR